MTQFPHDHIQVRKFNFVTDVSDARRIFEKITPERSVLFHTIIDRKLKKTIQDMSRKKGIETFDLTGPPTDFLIKNLNVKPEWNVTAIHSINEDYQQRIEAIEYTIEHDDGAGNHDLKKADVVLVGPSRSSKTPTSIYLATKGVKVANIPLIKELGEPEKLVSLEGDARVFAFELSAHKLCEVRMKRASELGADPPGYTDLREIRKELIWVRRLYEKYRWHKIDVTDRAIEETAALIMRKLRNL